MLFPWSYCCGEIFLLELFQTLVIAKYTGTLILIGCKIFQCKNFLLDLQPTEEINMSITEVILNISYINTDFVANQIRSACHGSMAD